MGRRKKVPFQIFESLEIGQAVAEGNCIAKTDGKVIFVKYAAPGDVADIKIIGKKKSYFEGKIHQLRSESKLRINPFCKHFTVCGGCKWQHLSYEEQLKFKQQQVIDSIERIGKQKDFLVQPIIGSENTQYYRNKLEFTFSNKAWIEHFDPKNPQPELALGFHVPGRFDKVLDIEECFLMAEPANEMRKWIRKYSEENALPYFDLNKQEGFLRNVMLRCNNAGEWMVIFSFYENKSKDIIALLDHFKLQFPQIISLGYTINNKRNDSWSGLEIINYFGQSFLTEKLGNYSFKIRPQSFFQTNSRQAKKLYDVTKDFAGLTGTETVYDLYTGTGSIAIYLADKAKKVIGIEYVEEAIKDANENKETNGFDHCYFFSGDMKDLLTSKFISEHGKPDVMVTDPPREGMHPSVIDCILNTEVKRLVYVSCNPATQARDIALLSEKYALLKIQPVDMFPHTHHVENVALLELKAN